MSCGPKENGKGRLLEPLGSSMGTPVPSPRQIPGNGVMHTLSRQPVFGIFLLQGHPGSILFTYVCIYLLK